MNYTNYSQNHSSVLPNIIQPTITPTALFSSAIQALQNDLFTNIMTSINMDKNRQENILLVSVCKLIDKVAMNDALLNKFMDKEEKSQYNMMHSIEKRLINIERSLQSLQKHTSNKQDITTFDKSMNTLENKLKNKLQSLQQYSLDHANSDTKLNNKLTSIQMNLQRIAKVSNNNTNQLNKINEQMQKIPRTSSIMHKINNAIKNINQKLDDSNIQTQKQMHSVSKQFNIHSTELQEGLMGQSIAIQSIKDMLKLNKSPSITHITTPNTKPTHTTPTNIDPSTTVDNTDIAPISSKTPQTKAMEAASITLKSKPKRSNTNTPITAIDMNQSQQTKRRNAVKTTANDATILPPAKLIPTKTASSKSIHIATSTTLKSETTYNNTNPPITTVDMNQLQPITPDKPQAHLSSLTSPKSGSLAKSDGGSEDIPTNNHKCIGIQNNTQPPISTNKDIQQQQQRISTNIKNIHQQLVNNFKTITPPQTTELDSIYHPIADLKIQLNTYLKSFRKHKIHSSNTQTTPKKLPLRWYYEGHTPLGENQIIKKQFNGYRIDINIKTLAINPFSSANIIPPKTAIQEAANYKRGGNELWEEQEYEYAYDNYITAIQLDPTNVTYKLNAAAAALKMEGYKHTLYWCRDALLYAKDAQTKCKAYRRMGIAEEKNGNITKCIEYYNKSQDEIFDSKIEKQIKLINNRHHHN